MSMYTKRTDSGSEEERKNPSSQRVISVEKISSSDEELDSQRPCSIEEAQKTIDSFSCGEIRSGAAAAIAEAEIEHSSDSNSESSIDEDSKIGFELDIKSMHFFSNNPLYEISEAEFVSKGPKHYIKNDSMNNRLGGKMNK
jgi:hypothetical protein